MNAPSFTPLTSLTRQFAAASGDHSPLHVDEAYGRSTAFGDNLVHGALGALACLAQVQRPHGSVVKELSVEFPNPMFAGVAHAFEGGGTGEASTVKLVDGRRVAVKLAVRFEPSAPRLRWGPGPVFCRPEANAPAALRAGQRVQCRYHVVPDLARRVLDELGARDRVSEVEVTALALVSYLVGMELPGRQALFAKAKISFLANDATGPLDVTLEVVSFDERFDRAQLSFAATAGGKPALRGELAAFVRAHAPALDVAALDRALPPSSSLSGKAAVVVGASRGLGAAVAVALARQGAHVYASARRVTEATAAVVKLAGSSARLTFVAADALTPTGVAALVDRVAEPIAAVVLSACPPLVNAYFETATVARFVDYVRDSVALMALPAAALLPRLEANGAMVMVSSQAVVTPVAEWAHYVAAKGAVEALARTLALQYPAQRFLLPRPPRLLTELSNTPLGRLAAIPVEPVAADLVAKVVVPQFPPAGNGPAAWTFANMVPS